MDILTQETLKTLMAERSGPCVSIYMPTHRSGAEGRQDAIRLKNLIRQGQESLVQIGVRGPQAKDLLEPAWNLLEDRPFWQHPGDGLALFAAPKDFRYYRLPLSFEELVVVTDRFHVKPLIPLLTEDGRFCLLTLSKKEAHLVQCTRRRWREIELKDTPKSLAEFLRFDVAERPLHAQARSAGTAGTGAAILRGRGAGPDEAQEKNKILEYFRQLDNGVRKALRDMRAPLVLAGVEYLRGIYKEANHYPALMEHGIDGNPEGRTEEELHRLAWSIVEPHFLKARTDAAAQYGQAAGTDRASHDIRAIVPAALQGHVALLFVPAAVQQWGVLEPATRTLVLHDHEQPGDADLFDLAATHTLLHGGTVYAVEPENMPGHMPLAAVFRHG